ncbi:hypothetical protein DYB32_007008 [Aphanomyces invadans]|nr:hypothetical protein DYB32_007008 [Aphanomyces invadans]
MDAPPPGIVNKCFPFHTASDGIVVSKTLYVEATDSICSLDRSGHTFRNLVALTPNPSDTRVYIEQSCGSLGWASLILAAMVPGWAAIALILLAWFYFTDYYRTRWYLLVSAAVLTTFAFASSIASFIIWSVQTPAVASFAGGYWVELAAAVVLLITLPVTIVACRKLVDINQPHFYDSGRRDATMGTYEHHLASPRDNTVEVK